MGRPEDPDDADGRYQFTMFPTGRRLLTGAALLRQQKVEGLLRYARTEKMAAELERRGWKFLLTEDGQPSLVAPSQE